MGQFAIMSAIGMLLSACGGLCLAHAYAYKSTLAGVVGCILFIIVLVLLIIKDIESKKEIKARLDAFHKLNTEND